MTEHGGGAFALALMSDGLTCRGIYGTTSVGRLVGFENAIGDDLDLVLPTFRDAIALEPFRNGWLFDAENLGDLDLSGPNAE